LTGVVFASPFLCASELHLRALQGQGMVVAPGASSSRRIVVAVENAQGKPLAGVTVRFRLPAEGPSGHFASGLTTETVLSGPDGRASVAGIVWNAQSGPLAMAVACSSGPASAELEIPIEIGQHSVKESNPSNPGRFPSVGSSSHKWLLLAGVIAGGAALGAVTVLAHASSTPPAPVVQTVTTTSVAPTVGQPSITIGAPKN
jgi:hypothetical protein